MSNPNNSGVVHPRRIPKATAATTLHLSYPKALADELRQLSYRLTIKTDKRPSQSLIARRAMAVYLGLINASPANLERERVALERMVTPVPQPARASQLKANRKAGPQSA